MHPENILDKWYGLYLLRLIRQFVNDYIPIRKAFELIRGAEMHPGNISMTPLEIFNLR